MRFLLIEFFSLRSLSPESPQQFALFPCWPHCWSSSCKLRLTFWRFFRLLKTVSVSASLASSTTQLVKRHNRWHCLHHPFEKRYFSSRWICARKQFCFQGIWICWFSTRIVYWQLDQHTFTSCIHYHLFWSHSKHAPSSISSSNGINCGTRQLTNVTPKSRRLIKPVTVLSVTVPWQISVMKESA